MSGQRSQAGTEPFRLDGKVAIVTGASKGIGRAIASRYCELGAAVVLSSRKQSDLDQVVQELTAQGYQAAAVAAKMGSDGEAEKLAKETLARFGAIDILVNNAACNPALDSLVALDMAIYDKIMNVNLKAVFELSRLCQPEMAKRGGGSVINISSIGGIQPEPGLGIYSVSKAALISLTKVMAKEWGSLNIRANVICPGIIRTKMSEAFWSNETYLQHTVKNLPLNRIGEPEEIAGIATLLAAPAGSYMTGGIYTVDGGFLA